VEVEEAPDEATSSATVLLKYTMARADLVHAVRVMQRLTRFGWLVGPKGLSMVGAFWGLGMLGSLLSGDSGDFGLIVWLGPAYVVMLVAVPELQAIITMRASPGTLAEQRVLVDSNGIRIAVAHAETTMRWRQFQGYRESAKYFDLPLTDTVGRQILVLPKRELDPADAARLRALLATHLTPLDR